MKSKLTIENRVWKYIRRNKKFLFSNVILVTGVTADKLNSFLRTYEKKGFIRKIGTSKSFMNSYYLVLKKLGSEPNIIEDEIKQASLILRPLNHLQRKLKNVNQTSFNKLFISGSLSRGALKQSLLHLESLGIINIQSEGKVRATLDNSLLEVNRMKLKSLEEMFERKELMKIKEHISLKKPLEDFAYFPGELESIIETITINEYLKRDDLRKLANVTREEVNRWWGLLKKLGIIVDKVKESPKQRVTYILSANRAKRVLGSLKAGAYEKDKELRNLWIKK